MHLYNVDPYILDPTKMDMIQNNDNEENRQEVVDLLSVSMHAMLMAAWRWKITKFELKESCEQLGFVWSDVDAIMRFWCQISKTSIHDDLINEWIGDDEQEACDCAACKQQSSSVQPATSKKCSNVGKRPQQPSIAEDNGVGFVQSSSSSTANDDIEGKGLSALKIDDESSSLQTLINSEASSSSTSVMQRLLALPATSISSAETSTTAKADFEEVDVEKMMVDNDESNSLQTINPEARNSSAESSLPATSSSSAKTALLATTALPATSSNANSSCTDIMDTVILSSDYNQIANIADQLFSDIAADNFRVAYYACMPKLYERIL